VATESAFRILNRSFSSIVGIGNTRTAHLERDQNYGRSPNGRSPVLDFRDADCGDDLAKTWPARYIEGVERQMISSSSPWEVPVGFSRAVRVGNLVFVSGTVGAGPDGKAVSPHAYDQAIAALRRIEEALREAGADLRHVVRTRMFVTDISRWEEIGKAHGEFFGDVRPATSMIEISRLIGPDLIVEIEADAVIG
jgi:enamine deaminase RidA (YjgF/YER057c/UK114 family)